VRAQIKAGFGLENARSIFMRDFSFFLNQMAVFDRRRIVFALYY